MDTVMHEFIDTVVATADPPANGVPNPIHDAAGAHDAGYSGALVAGVRTYGWAAATITRGLGERWLEQGWVDYSLRRPLYAGEPLRTVVKRNGEICTVACTAGTGSNERIVLDGTAGLNEAPWFGDLTPPTPSPGLDPLESLPGYDLEHVPLWQPLRPLAVFLSAEDAQSLVVEDLGLPSERYSRSATGGFVHPYFLAGRMAPLTRHNFTYGPTIHVRSQIQHRREARANCEITVGAQIVDAYDRNQHWYQVLDGIITDQISELAVIRHHTIFRPRVAQR